MLTLHRSCCSVQWSDSLITKHPPTREERFIESAETSHVENTLSPRFADNPGHKNRAKNRGN